MTTDKTALVTGGAGFIGSNLCDSLLTRGLRVLCLDNLISGSKRNIQQASRSPLFTYIQHDVTLPIEITGTVDYIFHLASPASVIDYQRYPEETALANSVGTRNVLKLAVDKKATFLFTSTSEVYGDPHEHPQKETYWGNVNPNGVRACYDESKRFGEMISMLYYREKHVDVRIIRIFNTYGPRMRPTDGRVISNFINQALAGAPIEVYGDGSQTRSFCYVSDQVEGLMSAMFTPGTNGEVINIGNPEEYTMLTLAEKIKLKIGSQSKIVFKALPQDDPKKRRPDASKAEKLLKWSAKVGLDEGLSETVDYYRSIHS